MKRIDEYLGDSGDRGSIVDHLKVIIGSKRHANAYDG